MKKLTFILRMSFFAVLLATWSSCSKSHDGVEPESNDNPENDSYMIVCDHVADVANQVMHKFFKESNDIGELASHAEEIKKMESVKDVYFSSNTMFVDIEGFGPIFYTYLPKENMEEIERSEAEIQKYLNAMKTRADGESSANYLNGYETAVVINQQFNEAKKQHSKDAAEVALRALENCGLKPTPNNAPTVEFFQNELFDYDIVLLIGHGMWDPKRELHWLATSSEVTSKDKENFKADDFYKYKGYSRDEVTIGFNRYEALDGEPDYLGLAVISEKFIKNAPRNFKKEGKVIFYNVACQSMMGGIPLETDENLRSYSLARILQDKGVGFYLGFDESSHEGAQIGGMLFIGKLASGFSPRVAYETLPDFCRHNHCDKDVVVYKTHSIGDIVWGSYEKIHKSWVADLLPFPLYSDISVGISGDYIVSPVLESCNDESSETEIKITLNATCPLYYDIDYLMSLEYGGYYLKYYSAEGCKYGFEYSTNENFTSAKKKEVSNSSISFADNINTFTQTLTLQELKPNTTYYCRAYLYDGYGHNYSKPKSFKTRTLQGGGGTIIPDVPGTDF